MAKFKISLLCLILKSFFHVEVFAEENSAKLSIHLLNYLAKDYGGAVEGGKVVSQSEYSEQVEFVSEIQTQSLQGNFPKEISLKINELKSSIEKLDSAEIVSAKALEIKSYLIKFFKVKTFPNTVPNLQAASHLFRNNCVQCHGDNGDGTGPLGKSMDPKPANFLDNEGMRNLSPYQAFNTITLGVQGTGMPPFNHLNEEDRWSLAFYLLFLRYKNENITTKIKLNLSIPEISVLSENEISEKHLKELRDDDKRQILAALRTDFHNPSNPMPPSSDNSKSSGTKESLEIAKAKLGSSFEEYKRNSIPDASRLALESYLEGIEPIEGLLKVKNTELLVRLETVLADYRSVLKHPNISVDIVETSYSKSLNVMKEVEATLLSNGISVANTFLVAFGIVIREALEAGLVLLLLFSILKRVQATHAVRWVHGGWVSALGLGLICYFLLEKFVPVTGELAESMEAYVGICAVGLLLYVGLWFHRNSSIDAWKKFLTIKVNSSIERGHLIGLSLIAFMAVFREIVETILFVKILRFDGHSSSAIMAGLSSAVILTAIIIYLMVKISFKINLDKLFKVSTFLILALAVILSGKSVIALQKIGVLNSSKVFEFDFPFLGFNSTFQVIIAQLIIFGTIILLIRFTKRADKAFAEIDE